MFSSFWPTSYLIRKEKIEEFVIKSIKENILDSNIEGILQETVESQIQDRSSGKDTSILKIDKAIEINQLQINNIIDAIAQGINVDTVLERIKSLEKEREHLLQEKQRLESIVPKKDDIKELTKKIVGEIHNFEEVFDEASPFIQKQWIRQFVLGILIDRENNRAICQIMKIPMVNHPLMTTLVPPESSIIGVAEVGYCHDMSFQYQSNQNKIDVIKNPPFTECKSDGDIICEMELI